ncbi:hypothetical protein BDV10DRAFT_159321 [Aspergillus recurvatus]
MAKEHPKICLTTSLTASLLCSLIWRLLLSRSSPRLYSSAIYIILRLYIRHPADLAFCFLFMRIPSRRMSGSTPIRVFSIKKEHQESLRLHLGHLLSVDEAASCHTHQIS